MKNPLVDALRQANAETESSPRTENLHSRGDEAEVVDVSPPELSLDLAASVVLPEPVQTGDEENVREAPGVDMLSVESDAFPETLLDDETCLVPVLTETSLPESSACGPVTGIVAAPSVGGKTYRGRHWLMRLGLWSPVIALLTLSTAAGAYALYQRLTVKNLNYDLSELSLWVENDARDPVVSHSWSDLPENNVLIDDGAFVPLQAIAAPLQTIESSVPKVGHGRVTEFESAPVAEPGTERLSIQDPAFVHVQSGFAAYQSGEDERAEEHYRDAIAVDANHRYALAGLAAVLQKTADPDEWMPLYEKLLALNPKDAVAASVLLAHEANGDPQRRTTRLKILLQRHPEVAELHHALGLLAGEEGRWAEARLAFLNAHRIAPGNANYSFNAAVSMEHLGQYDQARSYYQLASESAGQSDLMDQEMITQQLQKFVTNPGAPL